MKLDQYQLFSVRTCANFGLSKKVYESSYLYLKWVTLLLFSCTVWSPINQKGDVPKHIGKNIGTGMIDLLPSVNMATRCTSKDEKFILSVSTLTGSHEITRTKLIANSPRGVFAQVTLKAHILKGWHGKGTQLLGSWGKTKTSRLILDFWNVQILADSQISSHIKCLLIRNWWKLRVIGKKVPYKQKTPVFCTYKFSTLSIFGENGPVIYICMEAISICSTVTEVFFNKLI